MFIVSPSPVPVEPLVVAFQASPAQALANTKAVVAICVVFVAAAAVGAVGVPVRAGEARGALASRAVCSPEVLAIERAVSAIAVALPTLVTTPVKLAFVVTVAALPEMFVWSPVLVPDKLEAATVPDATIEVGVIAPSVSEMAGVVVAVATVPLTPLAVVTETEVTVPALGPAGPVGHVGPTKTVALTCFSLLLSSESTRMTLSLATIVAFIATVLNLLFAIII